MSSLPHVAHPYNSRTVELWTSDPGDHLLCNAVRSSLERCSESLKALFADCEALADTDLLNTSWRALSAADAALAAEYAEQAREAFRKVRTNAVNARKWDYGKGPYYAIFTPADEKIAGRWMRLASRCQTVTCCIEQTNTKFPAVPGEGNVPLLRTTWILNPFDEAKFNDSHAAVANQLNAVAAGKPHVRIFGAE